MNVLGRDLKIAVEEIEKNNSRQVAMDIWRLDFHLIPKTGWLSDPNGLCYYKGAYHVFFQYSPFDPKGGLKLWGHYKSRNLIDWESMEPMIFPDQPYDCHGAYTGSALIEDDIMYLYYTGNVKLSGAFDYITQGRESNISLAISKDGICIESKKCLFTNKDYPNDLTLHVRDPKVWKENDNYYMVLGARMKEDKGVALLYKSLDKENWQIVNRLMPEQPFGYMWECPDLFMVNKKRILSVSPQGIEAEGFNYQNVYQSGYYLLDGDIEGSYTLSMFKEWDRGFDFYAPQTFVDGAGRRILYAWMGLPDCEELYYNPTVDYGWQHALTMPREIIYENGKVKQLPLKEMESLRYGGFKFANEKEIICSSSIELMIENDRDSECCVDILEGFTLKYRKYDGFISFKFISETGCGRNSRFVEVKECRRLQLFIDHSSIEIFINDGEEVFTSRFYPKTREIKVKVSCEGSRNILWKLNGI